MTAWILFSLLGAAWFGAAAWLAERLLIAGRRPLRSIWVCALLCSLAFPVVARELERRSEAPADAELLSAPAEDDALGELAPAGETAAAKSPDHRWMPSWSCLLYTSPSPRDS